jgi:23S rRNA pseudouridine2605 synthase
MRMPDGVRIQKALADAGIASRRASEALVVAGRVLVDGVPASVGQRVDPATDRITVDGRVVGDRSPSVYLVLNKPPGVTSTVSDRHAATKVVDLIPPAVRKTHGRIYPVGRLDRDSEGLLLLTNDGSWAQRLIHPRHEVEREYAIGVQRPLDTAMGEALAEGIELDEGVARLTGLRQATDIETRRLEALMTRSDEPLTWYRAVLRQGWRRQLRRMFTAVGMPVQRLIRVRIGTLRLDDLPPGRVRELSAAERGRLVADEPVPAAVRERGRPDASPERHLVVSLDGPGSSGKSSVGAGAALALGYRFCDTGVLYRALTWLALERGIDPDDAEALEALTPELGLAPDAAGRLRRIRVGGEDVTERLHSAAVDGEVSRVARHAAVRTALLPTQRGLAAEGRIIMAGRDIGTVVLPDADLKLFIDVSLEERARRRAAERGVEPDGQAAASLSADLARRDEVDSTRRTAPLRRPAGAVIIRSDGNTLQQTIDAVIEAVRAAEDERA